MTKWKFEWGSLHYYY